MKSTFLCKAYFTIEEDVNFQSREGKQLQLFKKNFEYSFCFSLPHMYGTVYITPNWFKLIPTYNTAYIYYGAGHSQQLLRQSDTVLRYKINKKSILA